MIVHAVLCCAVTVLYLYRGGELWVSCDCVGRFGYDVGIEGIDEACWNKWGICEGERRGAHGGEGRGRMRAGLRVSWS